MTWLKSLRKWRRREDGNATIEFVIWFPFFFSILASGIDSGLLMIRHVTLERGLNEALRYVALNTVSPPTYLEFKDIICAEIAATGNCATALRVEMLRVDPKNDAAINIPQRTSCNNTPEDIVPPVAYDTTGDNELMFVRACLMVKPLIPGIGWGGWNWYSPDNEGRFGGMKSYDGGDGKGTYIPLVSLAAFVAEPI